MSIETKGYGVLNPAIYDDGDYGLMLVVAGEILYPRKKTKIRGKRLAVADIEGSVPFEFSNEDIKVDELRIVFKLEADNDYIAFIRTKLAKDKRRRMPCLVRYSSMQDLSEKLNGIKVH